MLNDSFFFNIVSLCCKGFLEFHDLQDLSLVMHFNPTRARRGGGCFPPFLSLFFFLPITSEIEKLHT